MREICAIVSFSNIVMAIAVISSSAKLNWRSKTDRINVIVFSFMAILYAVSAILLFAMGKQLW